MERRIWAFTGCTHILIISDHFDTSKKSIGYLKFFHFMVAFFKYAISNVAFNIANQNGIAEWLEK